MDTCIGDWHYKRGKKYKTPKVVVDMLVDIVSKNGNLMLNVPLPASGMPDPNELEVVAGITGVDGRKRGGNPRLEALEEVRRGRPGAVVRPECKGSPSTRGSRREFDAS